MVQHCPGWTGFSFYFLVTSHWQRFERNLPVAYDDYVVDDDGVDAEVAAFEIGSYTVHKIRDAKGIRDN